VNDGGAAKVPLTQTIFAPYNLVACAVLLLVVVAMHPKDAIVGASDAELLPPATPASARAAEEQRCASETPRT